MKYFTETPSHLFFAFMNFKMFLTAVIKDEHASDDSLQSDSSFLLRNSMMTNTTSSLIIEIQFFALFCTPYYLWYGIKIFSDYVLLLDVTVLVWKLKKNKIMQSTVKLTF